MTEQKISYSGFARLREAILRAQCAGYGPDAAVRNGLNAVGLGHQPYKFIIDPKLDGPVYPFMDWPQGWH